jgi:hypothetical protein
MWDWVRFPQAGAESPLGRPSTRVRRTVCPRAGAPPSRSSRHATDPARGHRERADRPFGLAVSVVRYDTLHSVGRSGCGTRGCVRRASPGRALLRLPPVHDGSDADHNDGSNDPLHESPFVPYLTDARGGFGQPRRSWGMGRRLAVARRCSEANEDVHATVACHSDRRRLGGDGAR